MLVARHARAGSTTIASSMLAPMDYLPDILQIVVDHRGGHLPYFRLARYVRAVSNINRTSVPAQRSHRLASCRT
jgi:hypothetical protein